MNITIIRFAIIQHKEKYPGTRSVMNRQRRRAPLCLAAMVMMGLSFAPRAMATPGAPDCSFNEDGRAEIDFGGNLEGVLALDPRTNGSWLTIGVRRGASADFLALARLREDGQLDPGFGDGGKVLSALPEGASADAARVDSAGRFLVAGSRAYPVDQLRADDFHLTRFRPDGTRDPSFGTDGSAVLDFAGSADFASAIALQQDGKILIAGTATDANGRPGFGLARYNSDGRIDTSFGNNGRVLLHPGRDAGWQRAEAMALAVQPDGSIVVAGQVSRESVEGDRFLGAFAVVRHLPNGTLDARFGDGGVVLTDIGIGPDEVRALTILADGRILAAGLANADDRNGGFGAEDWALARYQADGRLDERFGNQGIALKDWGGNFEAATAAIEQSDGNLFVGGIRGTANSSRISTTALVARVTDEGTFDPSFDSRLAEVTAARPRVLALDGQGRIVLGGDGESSADMLVARVLTAGSAAACSPASPGGGAGSGGSGGGGAWALPGLLMLLALALGRQLRRRRLGFGA